MITEQHKQIETLTAIVKEQAVQIQKVSTRLEVNKASPETVSNDHQTSLALRYWDIIANKMVNAEFSVACVSALEDDGRTAWIAKSSTDWRDDDKNVFDYVIRRFNLSSARLNKPEGLDLR